MNVADVPRAPERSTLPGVGPAPPESVPWVVRVVLFLACGTSGAALLAKLYGFLPMSTATLGIALPCGIGLILVWGWAVRAKRRHLASILSVGFVGGLLGTFAYDLVRIPFHLAGQRVFGPIAAYGVWIHDATTSSRFTDVAGWTYHFSNGITFGMMYALFMMARGWGWAIVWGLVLESIALASPFARVFSLANNYSAVSIAYMGHVAWGVPLGLLVQRCTQTTAFLDRTPASLKWSAFAFGSAALAWPIFSPTSIQRDARVTPYEFRVEGDRLNPDFLRVPRGREIHVFNPEPDSVWIRVRQRDVRIAPEQRVPVPYAQSGVFPVFVETERRSRSSFVIVEPVEDPR